jgi:hypothetical protein
MVFLSLFIFEIYVINVLKAHDMRLCGAIPFVWSRPFLSEIFRDN